MSARWGDARRAKESAGVHVAALKKLATDVLYPDDAANVSRRLDEITATFVREADEAKWEAKYEAL